MPCIDAAIVANTEKDSALLRIVDLEKELKSAKESNEELVELRKKLKEMETMGQAHDEELTSLLDPVVNALSGKPIDKKF